MKKAVFHLEEEEEKDTNPRSRSNMRKKYLKMTPAQRSADISNFIRHGWRPVGISGGTWPEVRRAFLENLGMKEQADIWEEEHLAAWEASTEKLDRGELDHAFSSTLLDAGMPIGDSIRMGLGEVPTQDDIVKSIFSWNKKVRVNILVDRLNSAYGGDRKDIKEVVEKGMQPDELHKVRRESFRQFLATFFPLNSIEEEKKPAQGYNFAELAKVFRSEWFYKTWRKTNADFVEFLQIGNFFRKPYIRLSGSDPGAFIIGYYDERTGVHQSKYRPSPDHRFTDGRAMYKNVLELYAAVAKDKNLQVATSKFPGGIPLDENGEEHLLSPLLTAGAKVKKERAGRAERLEPASVPESTSDPATAAQVEAKFWEFSQYLEDIAGRTGKYPWHRVGYLLISLLFNNYAKTVRYGPGSPDPYTSRYMATMRSRLTKGLVRVEDTNYLLDMEENGTFETTKEERAVYWERLIGRVQASTRNLSAKLRGGIVSGMAKMIRDWEAEDDS